MNEARVLSILGARNLRDLGGYQTADGKFVRCGLIYRSGNLSEIAREDYAALRKLGLRGICDLRTSRERDLQPYVWREELPLDYWKREYESSFGELRRLLNSKIVDSEQARAAMIDGYRNLPFEQAPAYREVFRRLAAEEVPLIFCCSAGKDRAGTAAALILTALGVPREIIVADYMLTDVVIDLPSVIVASANGGSLLSRHSPEVVRAILGCNPDYIGAVLDTVAPNEEAFSRYLRDTLAVDGQMLNAIRQNFLE